MVDIHLPKCDTIQSWGPVIAQLFHIDITTISIFSTFVFPGTTPVERGNEYDSEIEKKKNSSQMSQPAPGRDLPPLRLGIDVLGLYHWRLRYQFFSLV